MRQPADSWTQSKVTAPPKLNRAPVVSTKLVSNKVVRTATPGGDGVDLRIPVAGLDPGAGRHP
jgi:hypothetical protein